MLKRFGLDLWQLVLAEIIVGVHLTHIVFAGCPENFDHFEDVVETRVCDEEGAVVENLEEDAA
jgi:hypothetical protein